MGKNYNKSRTASENQLSFQDEFGDFYETSSNESTRMVLRTHGLITNQLAVELQKRGYQVSNKPIGDGLIPDILVTRNNKSSVIEVKSGWRSADLTQAVGQLAIYASLVPGKKPAPLVAVIPERTPAEKQALFRRVGIEVVLWGELGGKFYFQGLTALFGARQK